MSVAASSELQFAFEERRAAQAYAFLVKEFGGRENYTKVLKVLYLADRASLLSNGQTITGAAFVSMDNGPVLSEVYRRIKADPRPYPFWERHFRTDGYHIELLSDHGDDQLSDYDIALLRGLAKKYRHHNYSQMISIVHKLPEWKDPKPNKSSPLPAADILRASNVGDDEIYDLARQNEYFSSVKRALSSS